MAVEVVRGVIDRVRDGITMAGRARNLFTSHKQVTNYTTRTGGSGQSLDRRLSERPSLGASPD